MWGLKLKEVLLCLSCGQLDGEVKLLNMEQIPAGQLQRMKEALIERCLKDKTATVFCQGENLPFFRKGYVLLSGPNV